MAAGNEQDLRGGAVQESAGDDELMASAICLEGRFPVAWRADPSLRAETDTVLLHESNLMLLNALAVLEQPRVPEGEEHAVLRQELFRLEAKLDLVTSLAARLLARYEQTPPLAGVRLTARGFVWLDGAPQGGAGETGVIELHAHPLAASPLRLPATLTGRGGAELLDMPPLMRDALDKFLFRQHRRSIAESRQARQPG